MSKVISERTLSDWEMAYEDASDALRGAFRLWHQGTPDDQPERYEASSPLTFAADVQAPVFIIQGRHDTRTPARPVEVYEARMKELGKEIVVHWFDEGHAGAYSTEFQEMQIQFAVEVLGKG